MQYFVWLAHCFVLPLSANGVADGSGRHAEIDPIPDFAIRLAADHTGRLIIGFTLAHMAHRMRFTSNKAGIGKSIGIGCLMDSLPALLSIMIFFPAKVGMDKDTVYIFTTLLAALASGCIPPLIFSWTLPKSVEAA